MNLPSHIGAIHKNNDGTIEVWLKCGWSYELAEIVAVRVYDTVPEALKESVQKLLFKVSENGEIF